MREREKNTSSVKIVTKDFLRVQLRIKICLTFKQHPMEVGEGQNEWFSVSCFTMERKIENKKKRIERERENSGGYKIQVHLCILSTLLDCTSQEHTENICPIASTREVNKM